ncbi:hypothetical protein B0T24DRAFT_662546 [Lasiosphaeria ovina]|uniref:Uncharacterized protein n=1 Tax=Lasiosphaeria ovina TaxID=92902 RepID=A0AAE0NM92_9PEZI|nr:hypothetical protein B0T24DRAFT_662546 [Lasiosphaeria ovina]
MATRVGVIIKHLVGSFAAGSARLVFDIKTMFSLTYAGRAINMANGKKSDDKKPVAPKEGAPKHDLSRPRTVPSTEADSLAVAGRNIGAAGQREPDWIRDQLAVIDKARLRNRERARSTEVRERIKTKILVKHTNSKSLEEKTCIFKLQLDKSWAVVLFTMATACCRLDGFKVAENAVETGYHSYTLIRICNEQLLRAKVNQAL